MSIFYITILCIAMASMFNSYHALVSMGYKITARTTELFSAKSSTLNPQMGGRHGSKFRYLPVTCGAPDEHFPRILAIAGMFPGLDIDKFRAAPTAPEASAGYWAYDFQEHGEHKWGKVAVPGSVILTTSVDPVVLVSTNKDLGIPCSEDVEVLVVVDRGDVQFSTDKFYLCGHADGSHIIQWMETLPSDVRILGRIILCAMPITQGMRESSGGFSENGDD